MAKVSKKAKKSTKKVSKKVKKGKKTKKVEEKKIDKAGFYSKSITSLESLSEGDTFLGTSDLSIQTGSHIIQYEYKEPKKPERMLYKINPGSFNIKTGQITYLEDFKIKKQKLLTTIINTETIKNEAVKFFSKLAIYKKRDRLPKRSIVFYSGPGNGKTACIALVCQEFIKEDPGTVVINWDTSKVRASDVADFLQSESDYTKECTRLVFIVEDIGGEVEGNSAPRGADSSLLNLLDGMAETFKIPTFIIATTNHPENLLESLAARPGRFDNFIKLDTPGPKERAELLEFFKMKKLTKSEKEAVMDQSCEGLSIAFLQEAIIRAELDDKKIEDVLEELKGHIKRFEKGFQDKKGNRIGV